MGLGGLLDGMWHPGDLLVPKACSRTPRGRSGAQWPCDPPPTQSQWLDHVGYFSELVLTKGELLSWGWGRVGQSLPPPALPP